MSVICKMSKIPENYISLVVLGIYFVNLLFNTIGGMICHDKPRARTIIYGYIGMCVCHFGVFICLLLNSSYAPDSTSYSPIGFSALMFAMSAVAVFGICLSTPVMLYTTEIIQPVARNLLIPIAVSCGWMLNFVFTLSVPFLFEVMGPFLFLVFCISCLGLLLGSTQYVETLDMTEDQLITAAETRSPHVGAVLRNYLPGRRSQSGWYSNQGGIIPTGEDDEMGSIIDGIIPAGAEDKAMEYTVPLEDLEDDDSMVLVGMPRNTWSRRIISRGLALRDNRSVSASTTRRPTVPRSISVLEDLAEESEGSMMEQIAATVTSPPPLYSAGQESLGLRWLSSEQHENGHASGASPNVTTPQARVPSDNSYSVSSANTSFKTSKAE